MRSIHAGSVKKLVGIVITVLVLTVSAWAVYMHSNKQSNTTTDTPTKATKKISKPSEIAPSAQTVGADGQFIATNNAQNGMTYNHYALNADNASVNGVAVPKQVPTSAFTKQYLTQLLKTKCDNNKGCIYFLWSDTAAYNAATSSRTQNPTAFTSTETEGLYGMAGTKTDATYYSTIGDTAVQPAPKLDNNMMPIKN